MYNNNEVSQLFVRFNVEILYSNELFFQIKKKKKERKRI